MALGDLVKDAVQMGLNGRAYEATLIETRAITRLARAAGRTYGVGAITVTHGECDSGDPTYGDRLYRLWMDYSVDLPAITGQSEPPLMITSQQNASGERSAATLAAWQIGVQHPSDVVCSGPKYQYPYTSDNVHLLVDGYELLGEKYAQVFYERQVLGSDWQPLQPTTVARAGRVVSVSFHVPVPPLVWEETFQLPHQTSSTAWSAGQGFELRDGAGNPITILSVAIQGSAVQNHGRGGPSRDGNRRVCHVGKRDRADDDSIHRHTALGPLARQQSIRRRDDPESAAELRRCVRAAGAVTGRAMLGVPSRRSRAHLQ